MTHPGRHPTGSTRTDRPRQFDDRPLLVFWEMTKACDLACRHCRACAQPDPGPDELTTAEGKALIDQLAEIGRPRPILILTGGDCLKRSDIVELASHAQSRQVPVAIAPSVTPQLRAETLEALRACGVTTASLSLDGSRSATHDQVRGIPGHFDETKAAIRLLHDHGFTVQINTTVMKANLDELADIAVLLHEEAVAIWEVFFLISTGRGEDVPATSAEENEEVCRFLVDASRYGFTVRTVEAPFFRRIAAERRSGRASEGKELSRRLHAQLVVALGEPTAAVRAPSAATRDGKGIVFVAADGDVYPSGFMPLRLGNIRTSPLIDIYRGHPLLRDIRAASFTGPCGSCEHAQLCGGSRARAFVSSGEALGSDPGCLRVAEATAEPVLR